MIEDSRLLGLVARWEAAQEANHPISPEQLCREHPEYVEPLRAAIVRLHGSVGAMLPRLSGNDTLSLAPTGDGPRAESTRIRQPYQIGQIVAGFRLVREIGQGAFGQVFASEDTKLGRKVAIKFLHSKSLERPESRDLFLKEARALAAVSSDHVVPIHECGQDGDNLFLVMPLLAGETLQAKLDRDGILPLNEFLRIARELCQGLSAIHAKGLIHRDSKPANIWLEACTGRVKVLDLGLADEVANLRQGTGAGTPAYMSPEQVKAQSLDFRSDLFSLGAIFYECLTARKAFPGKTPLETIDAVLNAEPVPLSQANPATPGELSDLVAALLRKDRNDRPVSAMAVLDALPKPSEGVTRSAIIGGAAALLVLIFGLLAWLSRGQPTVAPTSPTAEVHSPAKLGIEQLQLTPLQLKGEQVPKDDQVWQELIPMNQAAAQRVTMKHAIDVKAKLSRPGYSYIVLYRADGESVLLYPRQPDQAPPLTDQPSYPPRGEDVAYQLNDGPGVWAVAAVASESPLPSFRDWQAQHPKAPWSAQPDPAMLPVVVVDDGVEWATPKPGGGLTRGGRGEIKIGGRVPIQALLDWWKKSAQATVKVIAFPVFDK